VDGCTLPAICAFDTLPMVAAPCGFVLKISRYYMMEKNKLIVLTIYNPGKQAAVMNYTGNVSIWMTMPVKLRLQIHGYLLLDHNP
jgi:hypothetical protein